MNEQVIHLSKRRVAVLSGLSTALYLPVVGAGTIAVLAVIVQALDAHETAESAAIGTLLCIGLLSGGLWGNALNRLLRLENRHWMMRVAGGASLFPSILLCLAVMNMLSETGPFDLPAINAMPFYRVFTLLFTASAFIASALSSLAVGLVATTPGRAARTALLVGLLTAACVLAVNLLMIQAGFKVGGPIYRGLAKSLPPMPTITVLGTLAGTLLGGGLLGYLLALDVRSKADEQAVTLA